MVGLLPEVTQFAGRVWNSLRPVERQRTPERYRFQHERVLGTSLELQIRAASWNAARRAEAVALAEIDRLEQVFSAYQEMSELRNWQRTLQTPERLSPELFEVLLAAEQWHTVTQGAFHPGAEEWTRLWKRAAAEGREPTPDERDTTLARLASPLWTLNHAAGTATRLSECALTLNAIAKGYIIDRACERALSEPGVDQILLNVGGDLRVASISDDCEAEQIGITHPHRDAENAPLAAQVGIRNGAVASSGGSRRGVQIGDTWYSHLFDPRSGLPVQQVPGASVVAPTAMDADALATAFSVLPPAESLALADSLPEVACLLITQDGEFHRSQRWAQLESFPS